MWTHKLLKENGKIAFKRNYWVCVAVCVIAMLLGGIAGGSTPSFETNHNINHNTNININNNNFQVDDFNAFPGDFYPEMQDEFETEDIMEMLGSLFAEIPSYVWTIFGTVMLIGAVIGIAMSILVSNVVSVGCSRFFIENREHKTAVGQLFHAFRSGRYGSTVLIMFLKGLYTFFWSLLFVIPGIIKRYAYALVPYILAENAELDKDRVLKMSQEMMKGHKWELFVLYLSFLGWNILGACTAGILNIFYVNPYMQATLAEFYSAVKAEAIQKGIVRPEELPGVSIPVENVEVVM